MPSVKAKKPTTSVENLRFIEPMYARLVHELPHGQEWLYEVKFDGYRCLAGRDASGVTLWSRRGNLFTKQFPQIAQACEQLPPNTLGDGEIVALDESGRVSFNLLQHHRSKAQALVFYAFDVLIYRSRSVLEVPLYFRRQVLHRIFEDSNAVPIGLSESIEAGPTDLMRVVKEFGFEGIVAKRRNSLYESGKRSGAWVKYKVNKSQEFVIGGYIPGPRGFDSIIVGYYQGKELMYVARVRNGFVPALRRQVFEKIRHLTSETIPFANLP